MKSKILYFIIIFFITIITFSPIIKNGFINWDDDRYIFNNNFIKKSLNYENVKNIFTTYYDGHYHPLTLVSNLIDYQIAQLNPKIYHINNLILHLLVGLMLFIFLNLLLKEKTISFFVSLLFLIHPMNVETVAWASERKNLLFAFFFIISLIFYLLYIAREEKRFLFLTIIFALFSILSKVTGISILFTLILLDYYHERKFNLKLILEKVPFFLFFIIFLFIARKAQYHTWSFDLSETGYPVWSRFIFGCMAFIEYLFKTILPINLSAIYPYPVKPNQEIPFRIYLYIAPVIVFLSLIIYSFIKKKKILFFCLSFFLVNIFFLLKISKIPVGNYIMADRYNYVPAIAILLVVFYYANKLRLRFAFLKIPFIGLTIVFVFIFSVSTYSRCGKWKDDYTFFDDIIKKYPTVQLAWNNRGIAKEKRNDVQGAIQDFTEAINIDSNYLYAYVNRGSLYAKNGDAKNAILDFDNAIRKGGNTAEIFTYRGMAKSKLKNWIEAIDDYNKAESMGNKKAIIYLNRGVAKAELKQYRNSITDISMAIKKDSLYKEAFFNRGNAFAIIGSYDSALIDFNKALEINPEFIQAYFNRANLCTKMGRFNEAMADYTLLLNKNDKFCPAYLQRAILYYKKGQKEQACTDLKVAIQMGCASPQLIKKMHCY